jgi:hypothetical protein
LCELSPHGDFCFIENENNRGPKLTAFIELESSIRAATRPVSAYHFSSAMWSQYLEATLYFSALERGSFSLLLPRMGFSLLLTFWPIWLVKLQYQPIGAPIVQCDLTNNLTGARQVRCERQVVRVANHKIAANEMAVIVRLKSGGCHTPNEN